ncbi:ABC transporter ATP-binding protein [Haloferula sp.]|uniref:ABC transporter ATP-binding protein n=1 Tax=Haloferula sp. TaxID=2497595 RepID=UPI00329FE0DA
MNPDIPALCIRDLRFSYPENRFRLDVEQLDLAAGERASLVGESGSGKTTLLQLLSGIMAPESGSIRTCGTELAGLGDAGRRAFRISTVGLVFQEFELLDYLTVVENVLLPYRIHGALRLDSGVRNRAAELLEELALDGLAQRRPRQLSHGQRQRVAVCRALITNPSLLLADEPTANLDRENRQRVLATFERHVREKQAAMIIATHDDDVQSHVDRCLDLKELFKPSTGGKYHVG